jgi:hypothetical protein
MGLAMQGKGGKEAGTMVVLGATLKFSVTHGTLWFGTA